nr:hypothetical protein [Marinicella sp. W31]MDC2879438.1 hypothetical protein [Marinicella sp. W31]
MQERANKLPVAAVLERLAAALRSDGRAVLAAPPGAGKTTLVPLHLLASGTAGTGKIILLEPRRLAARAAAFRMASLLGESPGRPSAIACALIPGYRRRPGSKW